MDVRRQSPHEETLTAFMAQVEQLTRRNQELEAQLALVKAERDEYKAQLVNSGRLGVKPKKGSQGSMDHSPNLSPNISKKSGKGKPPPPVPSRSSQRSQARSPPLVRRSRASPSAARYEKPAATTAASLDSVPRLQSKGQNLDSLSCIGGNASSVIEGSSEISSIIELSDAPKKQNFLDSVISKVQNFTKDGAEDEADGRFMDLTPFPGSLIQVFIMEEMVNARECSGVTNKDVAFYQLHVTSASGKDEWIVFRRYSHFLQLRNRIQTDTGDVLDFPKRRIRHVDQKRRRRGLQSFINHACRDHCKNRELLKFLDPMFEPCAEALRLLPVIKFGYLRMLVTNALQQKEWQMRFLVLVGTTLFYFREERSDAPLGSIPIDYIKVDAIDDPLCSGAPFCLEFSANSLKESKDWIQIIREARSRRRASDAGEPHSKGRVAAPIADDSTREDRARMEVSANMLKKLARNSVRLSMFGTVPDTISSVAGAIHFGEPDTPENIVYANGLISCGAVTKLIQKLTESKQTSNDPELCDTFLVTYRTYIDPLDLLMLLASRFHYEISKSGEQRVLKRNPIMTRVCYVLERWVSSQMFDFREDPQLTKQFLAFVFNNLHENVLYDVYAKKLRRAVKDSIHRKSENMARAGALKQALPTIVPQYFDVSTASVLDIDPVEIARQFTVVDEAVFHKIVPSKDLLGQKWSKVKTRGKVPNVMKMIKRFNYLCSWTESVILELGSVQARASMVTTLVCVVRALVDLRNFSGATALLAGMSSNAINRLRATFAALKPDVAEELHEMRKLVDPAKNHSVYRKILAAAQPPCIPYLGVYLSDLTFIEDGNPDYRDDMVNFEKSRMLAKILLKVRFFQGFFFSIAPHKGIQRVLASVDILSEEAAYSVSLRREPRK